MSKVKESLIKYINAKTTRLDILYPYKSLKFRKIYKKCLLGILQKSPSFEDKELSSDYSLKELRIIKVEVNKLGKELKQTYAKN